MEGSSHRKGHGEDWGGWKCSVLVVVVVSWVTHLQQLRLLYVKWVQFIVGQLHLNRVVKKNNRTTTTEIVPGIETVWRQYVAWLMTAPFSAPTWRMCPVPTAVTDQGRGKD